MKKIIFLFSSFFLAGIFYFGYQYYLGIERQESSPVAKEQKIIKNELKEIQENTENKTILSEAITKTSDEKIETLRKRFSLKGTIARGDNFFEGNQMILALNEYSKALRQNPKDEQIIKKLALTYFGLKRFQNAVEEFSKIESFLNQQELNQYILALLYLTNYLSSENIDITTGKIKTLPISEEEKFYYTSLIGSTQDFHNFKKQIHHYIDNNKEINFPPLNNLKKAIENYENFKINNLYYKDALIIGALFQDKMFSISNFLSEKILLEKPDYKPILLVLGKGYYELGNLEEAKKYLEIYYKLDPKDTAITYTLGNINFKLRDYITSNLYYNAALKNGFEPKIELQRKLAYNYYLSGDKRSMLNMFGFLMNEENATIDDFSLGIYHAILEGRILNGQTRSQKGLAKFNGKTGYEIFYGYLGWIERENHNFEKSRELLTTGYKINPKNPLITLNLGYLEEYEEKYQMALLYLKRTININGDGEFGELARKEIIEVEKYLEIQNKNKTGSGTIQKQ